MQQADKGSGADLRSLRFSALTCGSGSGPTGPASTCTARLSGAPAHEVARRVFAGTATTGWSDARTGATP